MGDETRMDMQHVKEGAAAAGGIIDRYLMRILGPLGRRIGESSPMGKAMAYLGLLTVVVSLVLIFSNAMWFKTQERKGRKYVNITYERKGYGVALLSGVGLVVVGTLVKDRGGSRKKK